MEEKYSLPQSNGIRFRNTHKMAERLVMENQILKRVTNARIPVLNTEITRVKEDGKCIFA